MKKASTVCQGNHLEKFFAEKPERFWKDEIFKLPERWRKIVEQNGTYII